MQIKQLFLHTYQYGNSTITYRSSTLKVMLLWQFPYRFEGILEVDSVNIGRELVKFNTSIHALATPIRKEKNGTIKVSIKQWRWVKSSGLSLPSKSKASVNKNASNNIYRGYYDSWYVHSFENCEKVKHFLSVPRGLLVPWHTYTIKTMDLQRQMEPWKQHL